MYLYYNSGTVCRTNKYCKNFDILCIKPLNNNHKNKDIRIQKISLNNTEISHI